MGLQWIVTGYGLTYGSLLLFGGRLGDRVGRRRLLEIGLLLFAAASAACALAPSPAMLVVPRVIQGVGAAFVAPMVLSLLSATHADGHDRARALGVWTAATAGGAMAGIVLGGLMTEYLGWRSVFVINLPIVALLLPLVRATLPDYPGRPGQSLDALGAACATASLAGLIFALSSGEERGFGAPLTLAGFAAALLCGAAFVAVERRAAHPIVSFDFLGAPVRRTSVVVLMVTSGVLGAYIYFVALAMQQILGLSGSQTSVCFLPGPIAVALLSTFATRRLVLRFGLRLVFVSGTVIVAAGQLWLAQLGDHSTYVSGVLPALCLTGIGAGLILPAAAVGIAGGAGSREQALAAGLIPTAQQIGATAGVAVLATIAAGVSAGEGGDLASGYSAGFLVSVGLMAALAALVLLSPLGGRAGAPGRLSAEDAAAAPVEL